MICRLVVGLLALGWAQQGLAQTLVYNVVLRDKVVGQVVAHRELKDNATYQITSKVTAPILFGFTLDYTIEADYVEGYLAQARVQSLVNGRSHGTHNLSWDGQEYIQSDADETKTIAVPRAQYSTALLYFTEPKGITSLFSENNAAYQALEYLGGGKYALSLPDGHKNYYSYQNGHCTAVEINNSLVTLYLHIAQ